MKNLISTCCAIFSSKNRRLENSRWQHSLGQTLLALISRIQSLWDSWLRSASWDDLWKRYHPDQFWGNVANQQTRLAFNLPVFIQKLLGGNTQKHKRTCLTNPYHNSPHPSSNPTQHTLYPPFPPHWSKGLGNTFNLKCVVPISLSRNIMKNTAAQ